MNCSPRSEKIRRRATRIPGIWLPAILVDPLRRCPHEHQRGIYGDEIIAAGWKRARCLDCGRLLRDLPPEPPAVPSSGPREGLTGVAAIREAIKRDRGGYAPTHPIVFDGGASSGVSSEGRTEQ